MADTAHASSRTSSLVQALHSQHVDKESFVLGMKKSTAPSFRESVSITSNRKCNAVHSFTKCPQVVSVHDADSRFFCLQVMVLLSRTMFYRKRLQAGGLSRFCCLGNRSILRELTSRGDRATTGR